MHTQVFPALYLPVMEEANRRVLRPFRIYTHTYTRTHAHTHTHTLMHTQVFPALYLPVMEEANRRVLRPFRIYTHTYTRTYTHTNTHTQVFPALYLPVMEEANRRVLRPYRMYMPILPEWWKFHSRMRALNSFLINYFRCVCVCVHTIAGIHSMCVSLYQYKCRQQLCACLCVCGCVCECVSACVHMLATIVCVSVCIQMLASAAVLFKEVGRKERRDASAYVCIKIHTFKCM